MDDRIEMLMERFCIMTVDGGMNDDVAFGIICRVYGIQAGLDLKNYIMSLGK